MSATLDKFIVKCLPEDHFLIEIQMFKSVMVQRVLNNFISLAHLQFINHLIDKKFKQNEEIISEIQSDK